MIEFALDSPSLARVRVSSSPLFEAVVWLGLTVGRGRHPIYGDPGPAARFALSDPDVAVAAALTSAWVSRRIMPDFLTPKPGAGRQVFSEQVEQLRSTPDHQAHVEVSSLQVSAGSGLQGHRRLLHSDNLSARAAAGIAKFWRHALADQWSGVERLHATERGRLGQIVTDRGIGSLMGALHPQISWQGEAMQIACNKVGNSPLRTVAIRDQELVLVPSVLTLSHLSLQMAKPDDLFVAFPIRRVSGAAGLLQTPNHASPLLAGGKAAVLAGVDTYATTRKLSQSLERSESTVSYHLHELARAGLVVSIRDGKEVAYSLTPAGRRLLLVLQPDGPEAQDL